MKKQLLFGILLLGSAAPAWAFDFSLKLEPGLAVPVTSPQSQVYQPGFGVSLKALIGLGRYVDVAATAGAVGLPAQAPSGDAGGAWMAGGGLRLKRPHDAEGGRAGLYAMSPWVDADALYVRTEGLDRFGFDVGAGLAFPLGRARTFWIGPFVRYFQIVQPERGGFDNHDAKILIVGLSVEAEGMIGRPAPVEPVEPVVARACPPERACPPARECPPPAERLPDRDGDGVPDRFDHCPDAPGPIDGPGLPGCPIYEKVVIKENKLELKEKILFAWDQAVISPSSYPLLDEVVKALKDNKSFHVKIDGHTDSSGREEHNQALSEGRAKAVLVYLVAHGVARERLVSKGFSSSKPIDSNATVSGRENNRRVEFVVELEILSPGGAP